MNADAPYVFLDDQITGVSREYRSPRSVIRAYTIQDVPRAFQAIEQALADGYYVAGYAAYELGYALDRKLESLGTKDTPLPLLEFGVFDAFEPASQESGKNNPATLPALHPAWSQADYTSRFHKLLAYINAGDIYQANLTFPYRGVSQIKPDLSALYRQLRGRQPVRYGAIVSLGARDILSLSPELFFSVDDGLAKARPMKGTAPRGATPAEDVAIGKAMQADEKSRAENLMIVDLLRNDLSRVSKSGSVKVTDLFSLETFPTLHQMTSGIEAQLNDNVTITDVFARLFPCGSVTGAPKIRAMEIIRELEDRPRGAYCGAIGYFDPNGNCSFNVAIRTLTSTPLDGAFALEYNVGSGVVYDSKAADEYAECLLKARIVTRQSPQLIETLKWTQAQGFEYLQGHCLRLMKAADALGYPLDITAAMQALDETVSHAKSDQRVRLALSENGNISVTTQTLNSLKTPLRLAISSAAINSSDLKFTLKTSPMPLYDAARAAVKSRADCDEMIFINERGHITEGSFTNIFVKRGDILLTPPLSDGLLPGVLRAHLLENGQALETHLTLQDLENTQIYMGNSVRGLMPASLIIPRA